MRGRQLFVLDREIVAMVSRPEMEATYNDMKEMGLDKPPYDEFTIQVPMGAVIMQVDKSLDQLALEGEPRAMRLKDAPLRIMYSPDKAAVPMISDAAHENWRSLHSFMHEKMRLYALPEQYEREMVMMCFSLKALLVVLLATKNIERHVSHNKLARLGVGKQKYEYVTTLKVGHLIDDRAGLPNFTGQTRRPHLRRGHIRRQKYGPKLQYEKKVWIEPVFVNGYDPNDDRRTAYNVSLSRKGV